MINKIGLAQGKPKLLTFKDRHGNEKSDPDPYFQPLDHKIEGGADDEHIEDNDDEDHEDRNANLADQGEEEQDAAITRRNWTHLPSPSEVTERIKKIGSAQGQPKLPTFQDRHGHKKSDPNPYFQQLDHDIEGVVDDEHIEDNNAEDHKDRNANLADQGEEEQNAAINEVDDPPENENEVPTLADETEVERLPDTLAVQAVPEEPKRRSGRITAPVTRFEPSFTGNKYAETTATTIHKSTIHPDTHMGLNEGQAWDHVVHYTMTQLSMKGGLKRWGNKGKQAVSKELLQLRIRYTFRPINSKTLSKTEYDKVLEYHLFLKQKRDHSIKGRMAAGGNNQRGHIAKTDA